MGTHDRRSREGLKAWLLRRVTAGVGSLVVATLALPIPGANALPRPSDPPSVQRDEIRARLGLQRPAPRAVPEGLAFWGNWTNGGPWTGWNNWPNWNNWQDWPDWPNDWNDWSKWGDWGNM